MPRTKGAKRAKGGEHSEGREATSSGQEIAAAPAQSSGDDSDATSSSSSGDERSKKRRRLRKEWTEIETEKLLELVENYGVQRWEKVAREMEVAHFCRAAKQCSDRWRLLKKKAVDASLPPKPAAAAAGAPVAGAETAEAPLHAAEMAVEATQELSVREKRILAVVGKDAAQVQSDPEKPGRLNREEVERKMQEKIDEMKLRKKAKKDSLDDELLGTAKQMAASVDKLTAVLAEYLAKHIAPQPAQDPK